MSYDDQLPKVRYDLEQTIDAYIGDTYYGSRLDEIDAVCDTIDGFCEDVCDWYVSDLLNTVKPMCNQQEYLFRNARRRQMYVYCPHCNRRVIEQFDILKEEGV